MNQWSPRPSDCNEALDISEAKTFIVRHRHERGDVLASATDHDRVMLDFRDDLVQARLCLCLIDRLPDATLRARASGAPR